MDQPIGVFWFRRDLRLEDNHGLFRALASGNPVLPLFILDKNILAKLKNKRDRRVQFISTQLQRLNRELQSLGSSLCVMYGTPLDVWSQLANDLPITTVFTNHDYEPYARSRDEQVAEFLTTHRITFESFKDQVIFEKSEIFTAEQRPYTVFTPFRNKWASSLSTSDLAPYPSLEHGNNFVKSESLPFAKVSEIGFVDSVDPTPEAVINEDLIKAYDETRDVPGIIGTTRLSVHLRFGTISIRSLVRNTIDLNETFVSELVWREFFMMILWHFPHLVTEPFRQKYQDFPWRSDPDLFQRWCDGKTGFPLVDAGMRELNATGFMHNRVRMLTANFLTRLLLIDWRLGEKYFAEKLIDYDKSANVGNWQWSAGCGVDAAPYFRIFSPDNQLKKFDPNGDYVRRWVPEYGTADYASPIIDYRSARQEALATFKSHFAQS